LPEFDSQQGKTHPHVSEAHLGSCLMIKGGPLPEIKSAEA